MNMTDINSNYELWMEKCSDPKLLNELEEIKNNQNEISERFYKSLNFGTAGLRGILGAGTNRMNIYTVAVATQGYANFLKKLYKNSSVAIAFDSRINSLLFAKIAASVFCANNIKVNIFKELMPTPILSYAVRSLRCDGGIIITASHNPAIYNGYKAYNNDGCQIDEITAQSVVDEISKLDIFNDVKYQNFDEGIKNGLIKYIDDSLVSTYISETFEFVLDKNILSKYPVKVVYTPLNGAGYKPVTSMLHKMGISNIYVVESQKNPDGNFPTCPYPNPETKEALLEGLKLCEEANADILLATDPDSDRLGMAVKHNGKYVILSGNQVGELMADYVCYFKNKSGSMPQNPIIIKSIVSSRLVDKIAQNYNVSVVPVLTGFKNVGNYMKNLDVQNKINELVFAFEESCGYLSTTLVRDKDAINACALAVEMTSFHKSNGNTLIDALDNLYQKYGYFLSQSESFEFFGAKGSETMSKIMSDFKNNPPKKFGTFDVISSTNYENSTTLKTNMIEFNLGEKLSIMVRPSGTEPKIKFYYYIKGETANDRDNLHDNISKTISNMVKMY